MTEENTPVEEVKAPVEELKAPVAEAEAKQEEPLSILPSEMEAQLAKAYQRGANLLYSELIGYLFSICEVFAANFKPENSPHHAFLGFVLQTMGEEFNKKYVTKDEAKDEKDDGKPEAVQGEAKEGEEAPKERHEDVQGGACGGQEACEEHEQEEEKVEVHNG